MSVTTNVSLRIDKDIKNQADALFSELGLNFTTAVNIFLRQAIREGRIPFSVSLHHPNKETVAALQEIEDMEKNPSAYKSYTDVDKMMEDLLK